MNTNPISAALAHAVDIVAHGFAPQDAVHMVLSCLVRSRPDNLASTLDTWHPSREVSVWGTTRTQWRRHWQSLRADARHHRQAVVRRLALSSAP